MDEFYCLTTLHSMTKQIQKASYTKMLQPLDMQLHRSLVVKTTKWSRGLISEHI